MHALISLKLLVTLKNSYLEVIKLILYDSLQVHKLGLHKLCLHGYNNLYHSLISHHFHYNNIIANCGQPEFLPRANESVPNIESYDGLPIEGSTIMFSCPPGLLVIGLNLATCSDNGEWEPNLHDLVCNDSNG